MSASGLNEWLARNRPDLHKQMRQIGMQEGVALMNAATGLRLLFDGRNSEQLCAAYLNEFRKGKLVQNNAYGLSMNSAMSQAEYINELQSVRNQAMNQVMADQYRLGAGNLYPAAQQVEPHPNPEPNKVLLLLGEDE